MPVSSNLILVTFLPPLRRCSDDSTSTDPSDAVVRTTVSSVQDTRPLPSTRLYLIATSTSAPATG